MFLRIREGVWRWGGYSHLDLLMRYPLHTGGVCFEIFEEVFETNLSKPYEKVFLKPGLGDMLAPPHLAFFFSERRLRRVHLLQQSWSFTNKCILLVKVAMSKFTENHNMNPHTPSRCDNPYPNTGPLLSTTLHQVL